jgi:uncharacterized protein (DUF1501 family)
MAMTRRDFLRNGVGAFTIGLAAPSFLTELARAQGAGSRALVVLYLGGGNDALSMLVPYADSFYYSRRPSIAVPAGEVLQIGSDRNRAPLGLHPRLTGLRGIFDEGRLAIVQRTGYENSSRSHFLGQDIWGSANPANPQTKGWLGRYLDTLPSPVNPLVAWNALREVPRALMGDKVSVPAIPSAAAYTYASPNTGGEAALERAYALRIASHVPIDRPHLAFVNANIDAAMNSLDKVALVTRYTPSLTYPTSGLGQTMRTVAGAMASGIGTKVFWVQLGGFDTHASQVGANGAYPRLMTELNDPVTAFYSDLRNQGLLSQALVMGFSEFGRRAYENGSLGTDHGHGGCMFVLGGRVNGGQIVSRWPGLREDELFGPGDLAATTDYRDVLAEVCSKSLSGASVEAVFPGHQPQPLGLVR